MGAQASANEGETPEKIQVLDGSGGIDTPSGVEEAGSDKCDYSYTAADCSTSTPR